MNRLISLATASLLTAAFAAGPAFAQTGGSAAAPPADNKKPPAAAAATSSKPETVEQRISTLKTALKITPDQEGKWNAVASAMRDNASMMEKVIKEKRDKMASMNAVEDLKTYEDITKAHLDGLKNLSSAFKSLYDTMTPEQKKNADKVFDSYGPPKSGQQG